MKLEIGKEYNRTELHNFFGNRQSQGGISLPKEYKQVFQLNTKNLARIMDMKVIEVLEEFLIYIQNKVRLEICNLLEGKSDKRS